MVIKSNDDFGKLERVWNELLSQSPANNYFLTWEWLWNWWQVFARTDDELSIFVLEKGDKVAAIAPFYVRKKLLRGIYPVRRMMFLGTQEEDDGDVGSDYMDIICGEGEERGCIGNIFEFISKRNLCDEIYLSKINSASGTFDLLQKESDKHNFLKIIVNDFVSPYIKLPSKWDDYINSLSASMRHKIRKERRKLQKSGNVVIKKVDDKSDLIKGFDELVRLHRKRWEAKGMRGAFSNEKFISFHKRLIPSMMDKKQLELVFLSEDNGNKAVLYNIIYNNKIYFYQSGREINENKTAYGYLLHSYCIEDAIRQGLGEYDFLPKGGADDYKDRFSTSSRRLSDIYMARHPALKQFMRVRESSRKVYHVMKPYLLQS